MPLCKCDRELDLAEAIREGWLKDAYDATFCPKCAPSQTLEVSVERTEIIQLRATLQGGGTETDVKAALERNPSAAASSPLQLEGGGIIATTDVLSKSYTNAKVLDSKRSLEPLG